MAKHLRFHTPVHVWIQSYIMLMQNNSPVEEPMILTSSQAIDRAIHTPSQNHLTPRDAEALLTLYST